MTESERQFMARAIRRRKLFLALSIGGLAVSLFLVVLYSFLRWRDPAYPIGPRAVIVLLILLNSRQNLRQFKYSRVLEELTRPATPAS